jgi:hypothetical protein
MYFRLLSVKDMQRRTTVDPEYIEFATAQSSFLQLIKKKKSKK